MITKAGTPRYLRWLGFIDVESAQRLSHAHPVKLEIHAISHTDGLFSDWHRLEQGEFVQGCLMRNGVYAVLLDGQARVIN